jgi:hypothetical protein
MKSFIYKLVMPGKAANAILPVRRIKIVSGRKLASLYSGAFDSFIFIRRMKVNRHIQKCIAIILLLVFSQKIGVGLYLHSWLHTNTCKQSTPAAGSVIKLSCNCVDDFSTPFSDPVAATESFVEEHYQRFIAAYKPSASIASRFFYCLRGPPAIAA